MSQDEFTKLFTYIQKEFADVKGKLAEHDKRFDNVTADIAEGRAEMRDYHHELLALGHKVDRLELLVHETAQKAGIKLSYE